MCTIQEHTFQTEPTILKKPAISLNRFESKGAFNTRFTAR
jgi:hypothetical protein